MAVSAVLDTNIFAALDRGDLAVRPYFNADTLLYVPFVVLAELRAGFLLGTKLQHNQANLAALLDQPNVEVLHTTDKTTRLFAQIFTGLRKIGKPINTNDMWIAALCIEHNLPLLTKDKDFAHISGLQLL